MKANVVHIDLNPCGGAEHVAIATIRALIGMGIDVELTTARVPDISKLRNAFGSEKINMIFNSIKKINLLDSLPSAGKSHADNGGTITINTHGDMLPYHLAYFSGKNSVTYCHYPLAIELIRRRDPFYAKYLTNLGLAKFSGRLDGYNNLVWRSLENSYLMMLRHSMVVTNSTFSKYAIQKVLSMGASNTAKLTTTTTDLVATEPMMIPPPVNVEEFRQAALHSKEREDFIVVISRFNPSKKLKNAIALARMLKQQNIGKGMIIAGGLMPEDYDYYMQVVKMISACNVSDYVELKVNVTLDTLKSILHKGKVYFHPMPGEPFGISTAEAMSAGLIPIVPHAGGHSDFVPEKYRYDSLEDAAEKISLALSASQVERNQVSRMVIDFSEINYVKNVQKMIANLLHGVELSASAKAATALSTRREEATAA